MHFYLHKIFYTLKLNERKANRIKILTGNITALDLNDVENKSLSDMFGEGLSSLRHILAG